MPRIARFPAEAPASKKDMKRAWHRNPWHWFWIEPESVAAGIEDDPKLSSWKGTILQCEALAICKKYQVMVKELDAPPLGTMVHLYIQRRNRSKIRPWADFQRIKNDLVGDSFTAVEVYPPEDELVDDVDMWHLWCFPEGVRLPFWIGNARGDDVEWTFPGLPKVCALCKGSGGDGNTCPQCCGTGEGL